MTLVFWFAVAVVAYVYAGYPALLNVWARVRPKPLRIADCGLRNDVTIVIAARNEGHRLAARIDNLLSLDYPADRRQIIVVSDGSTDDTLDVLGRYADTVETIAIPTGGKAAAVNAGVARAAHELIVF